MQLNFNKFLYRIDKFISKGAFNIILAIIALCDFLISWEAEKLFEGDVEFAL